MYKYFRLLRVHHWYKNLVVFLALFFTKNVLNLALLERSVLAFVSLCFMSSSYYILNDIKDRQADGKHPEKRNRPIASGAVSVGQGYELSFLLFCASCAVGYSLSLEFLLFPLALFALTMAYNFYLKDVAIVDLHVIAVNFLLRAVSGAVVIDVAASPWLVMTVFFLALLLGIAKRRSELALLGANAVEFKKVYAVYTQQFLDLLMAVVSSILLFAYSLYTFFVHQGGYMMLTIPFASFIVFRYIHFACLNDKIARKAQYIILDRQILVGFVLWVLTSFYVLYVTGQ